MTESATPPGSRDICAVPVNQLSSSERRQLLEEAEAFLTEQIPPRNQPSVEESTAVSISPYASRETKRKAAEIQEEETKRLKLQRLRFNRRDLETKSEEEIIGATTDRLLEKVIVMLGLRQGEAGTRDLRLFGDARKSGFDMYLAHEGIDQGAKTDAIATVGTLVLRIDAATGNAIPKMGQNFIYMRELGTMGPMQTVILKPLSGPSIRGADVDNAPRFIVALSRPTVLRLAQTFVSLSRAAKTGERSDVIAIEGDIMMDEVNLWIIEQLALQAKVYSEHAATLRTSALTRQEQLEKLLNTPEYTGSEEKTRAAQAEIEHIRGTTTEEGYVKKITDMRETLDEAFEKFRDAYNLKFEEINAARRERGLKELDPDDATMVAHDRSHEWICQILDTPEHVAHVASLSKDEIKRGKW